ncbi:CobW family GTP-binding protein [Metabacillus arenae]|uniref:GTP-binding protein n=1 Tax=Metabacillus arenae TaxID=2771434 RepID=A0A926RXL1_9BACI|nr:CobW family GTP-binding protein [Metabacillus arenae]MBD1380252.1 GTP-binding protein [Metabacillus arenae]
MIPVYVISGFLGSGKTTVLLHMIKEWKEQGKKVGIILNELGDENVEKHLFKEETIYELLNGCICCSIQEDLKTALQQFITEQEKNPTDVLLIEGTGVANPIEIKSTLLSADFIDQFQLCSMIGVVDASHYLEYQSVFSSSKEIRELLREQISSSTLLLVNKKDLVSERENQKVFSKLEKIVGEEVAIIPTTFGKVSMDILTKERHQTVSFSSAEVHEKDHVHHHHHHIHALKITEVTLKSRKSLEQWLKRHSLLRAKGIVFIEDENKYYDVQFAANKARWHETEKADTLLILIGDSLNVTELHESAAIQLI